MHIIDERVFRRMRFHVFNVDCAPIAVCMHAEDAAAMVALLGDGACIADPNGSILWYEGSEEIPAVESYDRVREIMHGRMSRRAERAVRRS